MSPEQVRGQAPDHRSDIFSFGAMLYEMVSGQRAFEGDSAIETMSAILKHDPPLLSATDAAIPPPLASVIQHCLEKERDQRFQSARDLAFALSRLTEHRASGATVAACRHAASLETVDHWICRCGAAHRCGGAALSAARLTPVRDPPSFRQLDVQARAHCRGTVRPGRSDGHQQRVLGREDRSRCSSTRLDTGGINAHCRWPGRSCDRYRAPATWR